MAAPSYGMPPRVASAQLRGLANQTTAWMRAQGYDVPNSQVVVAPAQASWDGRGIVRDQATGQVMVTPAMSASLQGLAGRVYRGAPVQHPGVLTDQGYSRADVALLLHELVHGRTSDEGMTEATAMDLIPAWAQRFLGQRMSAPAPGYRGGVQEFRLASARATGKPWTSREARVWRRAQVNAQRAGS